MTKFKTNSPYFWLGLIIIIAGGWLLFHRSSNAPATGQKVESQTVNSKNTTQSNGQTLVGLLKKSNNPKRGNLMLITGSQTIYISTSRDYTTLLDKQVIVTYDGTLDNFRLGDITAK